MPEIKIGHRRIGPSHAPLVVAEIGINHDGDFNKAVRMVDDASSVGCECVKFQYHVVEDEMIPNDVVPPNAAETIWQMMERCSLTQEQHVRLKQYVESKGMIYLCTPFSRAAADRLKEMDVCADKIGSGECNNYPLVKHIASFGRPVILSTGMNDMTSIQRAVEILRGARVPFAVLHCTSMYPAPYEQMRLGALRRLTAAFPDAVVGLSDHSMGNYVSFAAVALGARIIEKHFTSDKSWPGSDISLSVDPEELGQLIEGTRAVHAASGDGQDVLDEEKGTIDFAYACVVSLRDIRQGERLTMENTWVKRPGTGQIKAPQFEEVLGKTVRRAIPRDTQLRWDDLQ